MGGYGSGQYQHYNAKSTVEDCITLNMFSLSREGWITWNEQRQGTFTAGDHCKMQFALANNLLILRYTFTAGPHQGREVAYRIRISQTEPHFGGQRLWFHCPNCDRRAGKLHLAPGQLYYLCRRCANLTYQSTREPTLKKLMAQIQAREQRITQLCAKYGIDENS